MALLKRKEVDMLQGNLLKNIILFSIPVMLSGILQLLFNACDLIVVGRFAGDNALAAVGSTSALTSLLVNVFMGISIGANVCVAKAIGSKNKEKAEKTVHTAILFSLIAGLFVMLLGIFCSNFFLRLLDTNIEVLDDATLYLQIYFSGAIFNLLYNYGAAILRAKGETQKPLEYLFIAGITNVVLNIFFVTVLNMDVDGVALATIASQAISAFLVIRLLMKTEGYTNLDLKKLKIDGTSLKEMIYIGLPAGIQGSLFSISNVFIQKAVNSLGSTAIVAGNTASSNIGGFIYTSMNAVYQACISFTSQNYGAKNLKRCKDVLYKCLICVTVIGITIGGLAVLFGEPLLSIYVTSDEALKQGFIRLKIVALTYFLCGIADVIVGGMRGYGKSIVPMVISIIGICGFRIYWIYTAFKMNPTARVLYYSYPLSWLITSIMNIVAYRIIYKYIVKKEMLEISAQVQV